MQGHRIDLKQLQMYNALLALISQATRSNIVVDKLEQVRSLRLLAGNSKVQGIGDVICRMCGKLQWQWKSATTFSRAEAPDFAVVGGTKKWLQHELRMEIKNSQIRAMVARGGRKDVKDLDGNIDLESTVLLLRVKAATKDIATAIKKAKSLHGAWDNPAKGFLESILTGAVATMDRMKHMKLVDTDLCPFCKKDIKEDIWHMLWECEAWREVRQDFLLVIKNTDFGSVWKALCILPESGRQIENRNRLGALKTFAPPPPPPDRGEFNHTL